MNRPSCNECRTRDDLEEGGWLAEGLSATGRVLEICAHTAVEVVEVVTALARVFD